MKCVTAGNHLVSGLLVKSRRNKNGMGASKFGGNRQMPPVGAWFALSEAVKIKS
jgi:hypothetical protein